MRETRWKTEADGTTGTKQGEREKRAKIQRKRTQQEEANPGKVGVRVKTQARESLTDKKNIW